MRPAALARIGRRCLLALPLCVAPALAGDKAVLSGNPGFHTAVPLMPETETVPIAAFAIDPTPVTNKAYLDFVMEHPQWRRNNRSSLFADSGYLRHWRDDTSLGNQVLPQQPVTQVSWFAARAYCQARGGRLPSWHEWEYAAAADESRPDARTDPAWRQRILAWYSVPSGQPLPEVARDPANVWGVYDLNGVLWEWVEDFNGILVSADNREQGGADKILFCGAGALSLEQKENYAVLMRVAILSSLQGKSTTQNLGFRCVYDIAK